MFKKIRAKLNACTMRSRREASTPGSTAKLLPGQNWPRSIEDAIESTDFVIACFSQNSVSKKGGFQAEIRYALDCARRVPLDDVFLIPVRLDGCLVPSSIRREIQYIDLFPDWARGFRRIVTILNRQHRKRPISA
jgi:hypothetical protein